MIKRTKEMIARPYLPGSKPSCGDCDFSCELLRAIRVHSAVTVRGRFSYPWSYEIATEEGSLAKKDRAVFWQMVIHIMMDGAARVEIPEIGTIDVKAGDIFGVPYGTPHKIGDGEAPALEIGPMMRCDPGCILHEINHGGGGAGAEILSVFLDCERHVFDSSAPDLPSIFVVRTEDSVHREWMTHCIEYLVQTASDRHPGSACLAARLTETLFVAALQLHLEGENSLVARLKDRRLRRLLSAIHDQPLADWTTHSMAKVAGLSRTALGLQCRVHLATSPKRYLKLCRLQLGTRALLSGATIAASAEAAGYGSEEAFSRAFRRIFGSSPAAWRRKNLTRDLSFSEGAIPPA